MSLAAVIPGGLIAAQVLPDVVGTPTLSTAIYNPDPNHLWNRLFAAFYRQRVANNSFDRNTVGWDMNRVGEPRWIGPDVLDPPIGYEPRFLLADEPFARCDAVLDEFISRQGATMMADPLERAMLQRDLWAVFDVLAQAGQEPLFPFPTSTEFINRSPLPAPLEQHHATLERKLAIAIRALALSRRQIESLPDTYNDAIRSGAFPAVLDTNRYDFLPHDLFVPGSGWHEVVPGHALLGAVGTPQVLEILEHTLVAGGRCVFRTFVKLPADARDPGILARYAAESRRVAEENDRHFAEWRQFWSTNRLARSNVLALAREPDAWQQFARTNPEAADHVYARTAFDLEEERNRAEWQQYWSTNTLTRSNVLALLEQPGAWAQFEMTNSAAMDYYRHLDPKPVRRLPRLPSGMQLVLLREMISLDQDGRMVPTRVVESLQFRTRSHTDHSGVERALFREAELSRELLFQGRQGGLRAIPRSEPRASFYNSLGHLRMDEAGNGPALLAFPRNCANCHTSNELVSPVAAFAAPSRAVDIEPIARWKQENGKLDLLRELMFAPVGGAR